MMGIDIGGTKTGVVALDLAGTVVAERRAPSGRGPSAVVAVAVDVAHECAAAVGGWSQITSVGACMPGLVDPRAGLVRHAVNLGVDDLPLAGALSDALGRPVVIDNDVKAAGWGAFQLHGGDSQTAFGYLNIGTGLAAALVINGQIVRGPGGITGEIGHLPLAAPVPCRCGQTGCLETSASGSGLTRMWPPARALADPFAASAAGDAQAAEAVRQLCGGVAMAVQVLVLVGGVEHIVIGGGLTSLGEPLSRGIADVLVERAAQAPLLAELARPGRFSMLPSDLPISAIGAARLSSAATQLDLEPSTTRP